jgi:hypothetical protein
MYVKLDKKTVDFWTVLSRNMQPKVRAAAVRIPSPEIQCITSPDFQYNFAASHLIQELRGASHGAHELPTKHLSLSFD